MVSAGRGESRQAWLLEVQRSGAGVRATLTPLAAATAAVCGYQEVAVEPGELERLAGELRRLLVHLNARGEVDEGIGEEVRKVGHLLFDELLPPAIKDFLRQREGLELLIRTDEALADIPWELLHTGEGYLALRCDMGRLLALEGLHALTPSRRLASPLEVLIVADPSGDLDAAYEEGQRVRGVLDGQDFLRVTLKTSEVERTYLRENIRNFDILHFAGHGQVGGAGEGWLLSDGRFGVEDVERLRGGRPFPSLIFANACGSGRAGADAALLSMARRCLQAGTRHFIGTHWDVPDAIAGRFAERFYRGLCHGLPVGAALRQARLAMNLRYGQGTILWGSYCLFGDPGHVYFPDAVEEPELPELPILDEPVQARRILHTLEEPTRRLGPHPALRSEAALPQQRPPLALGRLGAATLGAGIGLIAGAALLWSLTPEATRLDAPAAPARRDVSAAPDAPRAASPEEAPLAAMIREQEERAARLPPRVEVEISAQTRTHAGSAAEVRVQEGTALRSGDQVRLQLKSDRDIYAAVILLDRSGAPHLLFPHPSARRSGGSYLAAGETLALPDAAGWYTLDRRPGAETLLVLADRQPLGELDALLQRLQEPPADAGAVAPWSAAPTTGRLTRRERQHQRLLARRAQEVGAAGVQLHEAGIEVVQAVTWLHTR